MKNKKQWLILVVLGAVLAWPITVQAGGWTLVSLVDLPDAFVMHEPTTVQFHVLRHGVTPEMGLTPEIRAVHPASDTKLTIEAESTAEEGMYQAILDFPVAGEWEWYVSAYGTGDRYPMPMVTVQEVGVLQADAGDAADVWLMLLTLLLVAAVTFIFSRGWPDSKGRWVVAGVCVLGIVGVSVWVLADSGVQSAVAAPAERTQAELGAALFVAKGCQQCHVNLNAEGETLYLIGPNLTEYQGNPEFLRQWLADPQAVRPETIMPNLDLADDEIEALVAFLSS